MRKAKALQRLSSAPLPFVFPKIPYPIAILGGVHGKTNQFTRGSSK